MRRYHLLEFEDLEKFPVKVRNGITDYLRFFISLLRLYSPVAGLLKDYMEKSGKTEILDLCSGGGGATMQIIDELDRITGKKHKVIQSDKFPNLESLKYVKNKTAGRIDFCETPVDAMSVPKELTGFRTIFSSFHHFEKSAAIKVLQNAADSNAPIGIFDAAERKWFYIFGVLLSTPLFTFTCSLFFKPFKWSRVFYTYIIPLIPLFALSDGIVSMLRIYNPKELIELTKNVKSNNYIWKSGTLKNKLGTRVTYLIGYSEKNVTPSGL
jgi:hypothetical protein